MLVLFLESHLIIGPGLEMVKFENKFIIDFEKVLILGVIFVVL